MWGTGGSLGGGGAAGVPHRGAGADGTRGTLAESLGPGDHRGGVGGVGCRAGEDSRCGTGRGLLAAVLISPLLLCEALPLSPRAIYASPRSHTLPKAETRQDASWGKSVTRRGRRVGGRQGKELRCLHFFSFSFSFFFFLSATFVSHRNYLLSFNSDACSFGLKVLTGGICV